MDQHFNKLYWFCVGVTAYGGTFLFCLVYAPIPKENLRFADVILGFITGTLVTSGIAFLLGGNAMPSAKKPAEPGTTTAEISATIIKEP